jgi:hypothetical protein
MSNKIGVIVDGPGDYASLRARYKSQFIVLKTDGPRGHTVLIKDIVSSSRKQCQMLKAFRCSKIIVLLDFELRVCQYVDFVTELSKQLGLLSDGAKVTACCPNMMIENWYLADIEHLSRIKAFLRDNIRQKNYEGTHGKQILKHMMKRGHTYNEVKHGPQLFLSVRIDVARGNSSSFDHFLNEVGE